MIEHPDRNDPLQRLIAAALVPDDLQAAGDEEIEALLDRAQSEPMTDQHVSRILHKAQEFVTDQPLIAGANRIATHQISARPAGSEAGERTESHRNSPTENIEMDAYPRSQNRRQNGRRHAAVAVVIVAGISLLVAGGLFFSDTDSDSSVAEADRERIQLAPIGDRGPRQLVPQAAPAAVAAEAVLVGTRIETKPRERRRLTLPDGSILYVNENTVIDIESDRQVKLSEGEVYVEVVSRTPGAAGQKAQFVVRTDDRDIIALGTKFAVNSRDHKTGVFVTQGKVKVSGLEQPLEAGQELAATADGGKSQLVPARRASQTLSWTKDLMAAAESPLVPASKHLGGSLVVVDPNGQEMKLTLRKFHVDVHIEDGFARTTIDQTYFNNRWQRLEGTFYFPLPADASLSRLAMYVGENLMEGGMVERNRARDVFEQIRYTRKDPALLEWVDGSTFKMRVFPLEPRQEKRLILSYTQKLESAYGETHYRFPAGHSLELVRDWSTHIHVKNAAELKWTSPSHKLQATRDGEDLVLEATAQATTFEDDIVLNIEDGHKPKKNKDDVRLSTAMHEGHRYLMLRFRPHLQGQLKRPKRHWVFLFESSGDREPLLARVQIDVIKTLLENAEHDDTFSVLTAGTRTKSFSKKPLRCTPKQIDAAVAFLEKTHLVGAFDCGKALAACRKLYTSKGSQYLVHVGSAVPVLGEKKENLLAERIPKRVRYVGIGVGKRWSRQFMKAAARRTGGYFTQINPDEKVGWRAFELLSTLNAPRLLDVQVLDQQEKHAFLTYADSLSQGEQLCAMTRMKAGESLPKSLTVTGMLNGKRYTRDIPIGKLTTISDHLPRSWARLEIDRLIAAGAEKQKQAIITLSKEMYVMSPFTSLLVLENEAMYKQFNIDRGRKDHWALYPCPQKIKVVYEPHPKPWEPKDATAENAGETQKEKTKNLLKTIVWRTQPRLFHQTNAIQFPTFVPIFSMTVYDDTNLGMIDLNMVRNPELLFGLVDEVGESSMDFTSMFDPMANARWNWREFSNREKGFRMLSDRIPREAQSNLDAIWLDLEFPVQVVGSRMVMEGESRQLTVVPMWEQFGDVDFQTARFRRSQFWGIKTGGKMSYDDYLFGRSNSSQLQGLGWSRNGQSIILFSDGVVNNSQLLAGLNRLDGLQVGGNQDLGSRIAAYELAFRMQGRGNQIGFLAFSPDGRRLVSGGDDGQIRLWDVNGNGRVAGDGWLWNLNAPSPGNTLPTVRLVSPEMLYSNGRISPISIPFPLTYQRPTFGNDRGVFGDLAAHAPGMNTTTADVLSVLDAQMPKDKRAKQGQIGPAARGLIEKARRLGWESVRIGDRDSESGFVIQVDGRGRYSYEQTVSEGLRERVICDGKTLWHLYDELGIGARRTSSRFHRAGLRSMIPWLVPSPEELARGANVKRIGKRTVAITPTGAGRKKDEDGKPLDYLAMHLVFAKNGRLKERRLLLMPEKKTLARLTIKADGSVKLLDADDKVLAEQSLKRTPSAVPSLEPHAEKFVVLPLPYRSAETVIKRMGRNVHDTTYAGWNESDALELIASDFATGNLKRMLKVIRQRFFDRSDLRIGFSVLAASRFSTLATAPGAAEFKVQSNDPQSPLVQFLRDYVSWCRSGNSQAEFAVQGPTDGFVQRMASARNLYVRWKHGLATKDRTKRQIAVELERGLELIGGCRSLTLGWALLSVLQQAVTDKDLQRQIADAAEQFEKIPGLRFLVRHERARSLFNGGEPAKARKLIRGLYLESLQVGLLPPIDAAVRKAFRTDNAADWDSLLREAHGELLAKKRMRTALMFALQCRQAGDAKLGELLFDDVVARVPVTERPDVALLAAEHLRQRKLYNRADALLTPVLEDERFAASADLWRFATELANQRGKKSAALRRQERALDLEFDQLPDLVNLESIRRDYSELLNRYEQVVDASATLETEPPSDLLPRIIRIADRWRSLDTDDTAACQAAARIITKLGRQELAWDYLTTPLAMKPNEAAPWLGMAQALAKQNDVELAGRSYRSAFAAEPTNAQILWDHAELLRKHGRSEESRALLRQITAGKWQPRFNPVLQKARQTLGTNR